MRIIYFALLVAMIAFEFAQTKTEVKNNLGPQSHVSMPEKMTNGLYF
jgi:hypothetical protein